jgi:predicted membrane protein
VSRGNLLWGAILILIGLLFLLDNLYIMDFGDFISTFWPAILILIGIKIILDKRRKEPDQGFSHPRSKESSTQTSRDRINENNIFGDVIMNVVSDDFAGGSVSNIFGDVKIDLSDVLITGDLCKFMINGVFGDITIISPKGISLQAKASAVIGDLVVKGTRKEWFLPNLDYTDPGYENASPRLFIQGGIVFGSVNIF